MRLVSPRRSRRSPRSTLLHTRLRWSSFPYAGASAPTSPAASSLSSASKLEHSWCRFLRSHTVSARTRLDPKCRFRRSQTVPTKSRCPGMRSSTARRLGALGVSTETQMATPQAAFWAPPSPPQHPHPRSRSDPKEKLSRPPVLALRVRGAAWWRSPLRQPRLPCRRGERRARKGHMLHT